MEQQEPMDDASEPKEVRPVELKELGGGGTSADRASIQALADVALPITVELGRVSMSIRELLDTGPGSVIELDREATDPVDILAGGRIIARGEVVVIGRTLGVRVTELTRSIDKEVDRVEPTEPEEEPRQAA